MALAKGFEDKLEDKEWIKKIIINKTEVPSHTKSYSRNTTQSFLSLTTCIDIDPKYLHD